MILLDKVKAMGMTDEDLYKGVCESWVERKVELVMAARDHSELVGLHLAILSIAGEALAEQIEENRHHENSDLFEAMVGDDLERLQWIKSSGAKLGPKATAELL